MQKLTQFAHWLQWLFCFKRARQDHFLFPIWLFVSPSIFWRGFSARPSSTAVGHATAHYCLPIFPNWSFWPGVLAGGSWRGCWPVVPCAVSSADWAAACGVRRRRWGGGRLRGGGVFRGAGSCGSGWPSHFRATAQTYFINSMRKYKNYCWLIKNQPTPAWDWWCWCLRSPGIWWIGRGWVSIWWWARGCFAVGSTRRRCWKGRRTIPGPSGCVPFWIGSFWRGISCGERRWGGDWRQGWPWSGCSSGSQKCRIRRFAWRGAWRWCLRRCACKTNRRRRWGNAECNGLARICPSPTLSNYTSNNHNSGNHRLESDHIKTTMWWDIYKGNLFEELYPDNRSN